MAELVESVLNDGSGTIKVVNHQQELNSIKDALVTLNSTTAGLTTAVEALNTVLHAGSAAPTGAGLLHNLFGPGAAATPNTIPAIMNAQHGQLQASATNLETLSRNVAGVGGSVAERTQDFAQIASQLAIFNASAQIFIAQMARKQAFEVAATNAALERSGLPAVEPTQASVNDTMTTAVTDAVTVSTQAKVGGFISEQITNATGFATDVATNYIQSTTLGGAIAAKWQSLRGTLLGQDAEAAAAAQEGVAADTNSSSRVA